MNHQPHTTTNLTIFKPAETYLNISANRYQPSRTLSQFQEMDHDKTIAMISTILVKFFLLSGLQDIPAEPETIHFIAEEILNQHPSLEIGELVISCREGLSGKYGPLYKSIQIDTVGKWVNSDKENTWPIIEAKAIARQKEKASALPPPPHNVVPPPDWFIEAMRETEIKNARLMVAMNVKKPAKVFPSISLADYCARKRKDYEQFSTYLSEKGITFESLAGANRDQSLDLIYQEMISK